METFTMHLKSFLLIVTFYTLCVSAIPADEQESQNGLIERNFRFTFGNSTYEISKTKVDWYMAKIECSLKGMELVSIESKEEQIQIEDAIGPYNESMWISGGNNELDRNFYWESTGHAFGPYLNWARGEPDDGSWGNEGPQNCVIVNNTNGYKWNDFGCTAAELRFICEKRVYTGDQTRYTFEFDDSIYEVSALKLNWWNSKYDCLTRGMSLVSIETASENDAILQGISAYNTSDDFWVSATDNGREGSFHWDSTGGALGLHTDWAEDQPDNANNIEHCVNLGIGSYEWKDVNCIFSRRYLCEGIITDFARSNNAIRNKRHLAANAWRTSVGDIHNGKSNRFTYGNSTYEISTTKADWYTAQMNCKLEGMKLISIETKEEQEAIAEELSSFDDDFWTSGNDDMGSLFMWDSTGQTMGSYSNWASGQPDDGAASNLTPQNCVILNSTDNFKWHDFGCGSNSGQHRFICEKKTSNNDEVTEFSYADSTYEVSGLHVEWWTANRDCRSRGMQLVSIETKEENEAIINGLQAFNLTTSFWTAANDHGHERNFYWESTGEFLAIHSDWGVGEPNNVDGEEHCVLLDNEQESDGTFRWSDKPCSLRKRFVCELNATITSIY